MRLFSLLALVFTLLFNSARAQAVIYGKVIDDKGAAITNADIVLIMLQDSSILKADITDSAGEYKIQFDVKSNLLARISAVGYIDAFFLIDPIDANIEHDIRMAPIANKLKEVTIVTAAKPLIERKPDRIVFNVATSVASIGADAYDALRKAPGVRVTDNGVGMVGKSTVSIMINERLVRLSGNELEAFLRTISAENITKIEVIATPPARYDAQGNAGIINIITKKSSKNGFNGDIGIGYQQRTKGSEKFSENLNFRHNKWNIYNTGTTNNFNFYSTQNTKAPYATQIQRQYFTQKNNPLYNRYELGIDYNITPASVIGILYTIGSTDRHTGQYYNAPVTDIVSGLQDSTLRTDAIERENAVRNVLNLNYEWKIDSTGKKLNVDADYFTRTENDSRNFISETFLPGGYLARPAGYNRTLGKQQVDITSLKADMVLPAAFAEISFGVKASSVHTYSNNRFSSLEGSDYVPDISKTNEFDYKENTGALYASAVRSAGQFEMQLGLRGEYTQTKGISYTLAQTINRHYFQLFPTGYLQYSLNEDNVFNLSYSRRIDRPSFEEMNPFRSYGSGTTYESGNPFLQPSFSNNIELSYTLQSKYTLTAFTELVHNFYTRVSKVDVLNNTFYYTADNAGNAINTGLSASLVFSPVKWWETNIQAAGYYNKITSSYYSTQAAANGTGAFSFQTDNTFTCNKAKTILASAGFRYTSRQQDDFDIQSSFYTVEAGVKMLFFDKKLTFAMNMFDIFRTEKYHFVNQYNGVTQDNYFDAQCLRLSLGWKFGNNKLKAKRDRETGTDEIRRSK